MKPNIKHKHYILDQNKITQIKKLLNVKTEKEAVETAIDYVIYEVATKKSGKNKNSIEDIFDIAIDCKDTDLSVNHDLHLYRK